MSKFTDKAIARCFLIAPVASPLDTLVLLLKQREMAIVASGDLSHWMDDVTTGDNNTIEQSDYVIAVIGPPGTNTNTFYELGYAVALRKRVLIITPADAEKLPGDLRGFPRVTAELFDGEAIGFVLDQLRAAPRPVAPPRNVIATSRPIDHLLSERLLVELESAPSEIVLTDIVSTALRASGVTAVVENSLDVAQTQVDIGVWSDEFDSSIGNPLIIELKRDLQRPSALDSAKHQLELYLRSTHTRTALILYHFGPLGEDAITRSTPTVLLLPITELLTRLQSSGFGAIIRELRNRVVHRIAA